MVEGTPQMLVSSLEFSPYVGRIAVGRITRGTLKTGMPVSLCKRYDIVEKSKIKQLMVFEGLGKANVDEVQATPLPISRTPRPCRPSPWTNPL